MGKNSHEKILKNRYIYLASIGVVMYDIHITLYY